MWWQLLLALGILVLLTPAVAQEPSPESQAAEQLGGTGGEPTTPETDPALAARIRQGLQENAPLSGAAQNIRISVAHGEVLLQGEVKTPQEREGIEAQVRQVRGVQEVKNRLRVAGAEREPRPRTEEGAEGLRAAFERFVRAENAHDVDTLLSLAHDSIVFVSPTDPFPVEGKEAYRQVWQRWFENEQFRVTLTNPQVRTLGATGIAWGLYTLLLKPKDGPAVTSSGRYTLTFARAEGDGRWLLVAFHASRLPSERE